MERYSFSPWKRPSVSALERRTKTPYKILDSSQRIVRDFLESRKSLFQSGLKQNSGFRITRRYADLMDRFIRSLFLIAGFREKLKEIQGEGLALAALGSYGRRELCFGSDVDLLLIHRGRLSPEMSKIIPRALYPLWDARLEVGYSVLTVQECIRLALSDFRFLTSLMDARFLLGSRAFYRLFEEAFWSRVDREKGRLFRQFLLQQQKREEKYGAQSYFVEPDIKEGLGGLRDLHLMAWLAKVYFNSDRLSQIRRSAAFSHFRLNRISHSKGFLLKVRNRLHLLTNRKEDRLLLPLQKEIADALGYRDERSFTRSERFMKDLYLHLNRIRYGNTEFLTKALDIIDPRPFDPTPDRLPSEFQVMKGNIVLKEEGSLRKNPVLILKGLVEANQRGLFLGSGFIWEAGKMIAIEDKWFLRLPEAKKLFLKIILTPQNPKILRLALELGLITLFIPEFKRIRNLAQFGYYHVETVDLHSLKTLEVIYNMSVGKYDDRWPLFSKVFKELEHPEWLFFAGLLHDIGKGFPGDHSVKGAELALRILKRLDVKGKALKVVPFLIRHHLLLVDISQRRDLNDEKTSVQVGQTIQDVEILKHLFFLTIADSMATGPMASSDWKIMLLIELFFKARRILEKGTLASPDATKRLEEKKDRLSKSLEPYFPSKDIQNLMDQVSIRYYLNTPLAVMVEHFRLALKLGKERLSWTLEKLKDAPVTRVILCTYDKPGLFSKMVGVFTLNNIKVLSANIFTLKNGLAFDIYEVTNPLDSYREMEIWEKIYREAVMAIEGRIPLDELVSKKDRTMIQRMSTYDYQIKSVRIDNKTSDFFTIIEIKAGERLGLLYNVAKEIFSLGLDIRFARVNRDEERMFGVFYIRDAEGQKIYDDAQIQKIKVEIMSVLG